MKIGRNFVFHGAFHSKKRAVRKERSERGDFILKRKVRGHVRYVVVSKK